MKNISSDLVIFDLDGVITNTAEIHYKAWSIVFNNILIENNSKNKFTKKDYFLFVDGKKREDGIKSFLKKKNIKKSVRSIGEIAKKKNKIFLKLLKKSKILKFYDSIQLIKKLYRKKIKIAVASSSKNAKFILKKLNLLKYFQFICDGKYLERKKLKGKPYPYIFLECVKKIKAKKFVVIEDAIVGIVAAKRAKANFIIAVNRKNNYKLLKKAGATIVTKNLQNLKINNEKR